MNANEPIRACLIVDDTPIAAAYWMRLQQLAFGYAPSETGWGHRWRDLAPSSFFRISDLREFADFVEEHDIRGKFTMLPCPAGLGRIDRGVRGVSQGDLSAFLDIVRNQIAPQFDITPEVLTHTMAMEPETGALLPHTEIAWLSHLAASGQFEALQDYLRLAWQILRNVGLQPHGLTLGGMDDKSGIAQGKMANQGHYVREIAEALWTVESEFNPAARRSFLFGPFSLRAEGGGNRLRPEVIWETTPGARVYNLRALPGDPAFPLLHGDGDLPQAIDALVSSDLSRGQWIEAAERESAIVIVTHVQTLNAANTGMGLQLLRESVRRLRERYGKRLIWHTPDELCAASR
jgi:hypothetical protein